MINTGINIRVKQASKLHHIDKTKLYSLLKSHYPLMSKTEIFESYDYLENLYIYLIELDNKLIASRQIYYCPFTKMAPLWAQDIAIKLNVRQFAIGSRAVVSSQFQNLGLGKQLMMLSNQETYNQFNVATIFGSSTAPAAMKLYLNLGVNIWRPSLASLASSPTQALNSFIDHLNASSYDKTRLVTPVRYFYSQSLCLSRAHKYIYHWRDKDEKSIRA